MAPHLSILNPCPQRTEGPSLLHQLINQAVDSSSIAIDFENADGHRESLTYGELSARVNALAQKLRSFRNGRPTQSTDRFIVPVFIQQSPHLYITQLAVLNAGGAFCPLSLDVPEDRLHFILRDVGAVVVATTSSLKQRLPALENIMVVAVDDHTSADISVEPAATVDSSNLAYVMYTSGSTGQPKGVLISHSAVTQALLAHHHHIPAFSRFLQFASPTFDVSVFEIFFPLFRGSTLVCCDRRKLLSDLPGVIRSLDVDAAELTPSVASSLLQGRQSVPSLKLLLTIGETLNRPVVEEFGGNAERPGILHGMYGPTEATIHCTLQTSFATDMPVGNIGVPLETVSAFVIRPPPPKDPENLQVKILPVGEEGELAIGGHQLADGYLNRDEQNNTAFVQHPEYGRLYRTGDRARLLPNGTLEFLGRISSGQIKLRGQRIELGEIEYAASRTPNCRAVAADVISGNLVVFVVPSAASLTETEVRGTCRRWLPSFMTPSDIVLLDNLPYLASGKIDRNALLDHYLYLKQSSMGKEQLHSKQMSDIISILSDTLQLAVSPTTELASAGLDSLSSIRIASRLREKGYHALDATRVLGVLTASDLETLLDRHGQPTGSSKLENVPAPSQFEDLRSAVCDRDVVSGLADDIEDVYPCTAVQSAMLGVTDQDSQAYCNWIVLELATDSIQEVRAALESLASCHDLLRSGFVAVPGSTTSHAIVTWKSLSASQILVVESFDRHFVLASEGDLRRPCAFQLRQLERSIRVLVRIHHALYDQWSMDILQSDLAELLAGRQLTSRPSFRSVALSQFVYQAEASLNTAEDLWQDQLKDCSPTSLPHLGAKRVQPKLQRTSWQNLSIKANALRIRAKEFGSSPHAIYQAAMAYLLSTYIGNSEIIYGTVFSGRHIAVPDIEHVFGPCLTTLPARVDIASVRTCMDLLRSVHDRNRSMLKHSLTPLTGIKKACQVPPGTSLFDTLFIWQESTISCGVAREMVTEVDSVDNHEFNLVLEIGPTNEFIAARVTYQCGLIPGEQVRMFLRQLDQVVELMLNEPGAIVTDIILSLPTGLLSIVNPGPLSCTDSKGIAAAIEERARSMPSQPAVRFLTNVNGRNAVFNDLSYHELNVKANQIAHLLLSLKVLPDELVCICMEKSPHLYTSILAVIKAGAGYVPLVPETPVDRIRNVTAQAHVKVCLADHNNASKLKRELCGIIVIGVEQILRDEWPVHHPALRYNGANTAYTVFTSGSTGAPKGVVVTMDNLHSNIRALVNNYPVKAGDRLLQACSQAFDVSVFDIFFAFYTGMCLCSATKDTLFADLEGNIRAFNITHLSLTPTVAALIDPKRVPSVRFLVTAGEGVTDLVHRRWAGKGLYQGYGPSETTNICTVNPRMAEDDVMGNIGSPLPNTSAFVISSGESFKVLPTGAVGEFAFGGEQLFRGYLGMEDLNAVKIINHPHYGRLYRSADLGRILPDGTLLISGRLDDQVKIRGNRIELGEITSTVLKDASILDCTALVLDETGAEQTLVAFWIPKEEAINDFRVLQPSTAIARQVAKLFKSLENTLPEYMIPTALIPLTTLPLTAQGKLNTRSLERTWTALNACARTSFSRALEEATGGEGWTEIESSLAQALTNVLGLPLTAITRTSSFFALGLNSLNAIRFAKAAEADLHIPMTFSAIMRDPSIARMSRAIAGGPAASPPVKTVNVVEVFGPDTIRKIREDAERQEYVIEDILPCTPLQEAMLSASGSATDSAYCNTTTFRVKGDLRCLRRCFDAMLSRHDVLRTKFVETGEPDHPYAQLVLKDTQLTWDLIRQDPRCNEQTAPVDQSHPIQIDVYASDANTYVVLHMHHAVYDGMSLSNMIAEIEFLYHGKSLSPPARFRPFLAEVLKQTDNSAITFWSKLLGDFQPQPFPPAQRKSEQRQGQLSERLEIQVEDVESFCKRYSVSQLSVVQAAWAKALSCCLKSHDVCFGDVVSGRTVSVPDIDRLVAPCFNTIPVRAKLALSRSNLDLIQQLHTQRLGAMDHQLTALRRIKMLSASPSLPLFDSLLLVQPPSYALDAEIWSLESEEGTMDLPLVIELQPVEGTFQLRLHFTMPQISNEVAGAICRAFEAGLISCLQYPSGNVHELLDFDDDQIVGKLTPPPQRAADESTTDGQNPSNDGQNGQWTRKEDQVRQAFADLAKVDPSRIRKNTSMYQLGLDSLNAVQIAKALQSRGFTVIAADVVENPTPSSLAGALTDADQPPKEVLPIVDFDEYDRQNRQRICSQLGGLCAVEAVRPCTAVQNGMIAQSLSSSGSLYINHVTYKIPGDVTSGDLRRAWKAVQRKHQALRMGFGQVDDSKAPFAAVIHPVNTVDLPISRIDTQAQLDDIESGASAGIVSHLHMPAWRVTLAAPHGSRVMTLSLHHALYDADSLRILLADLAIALRYKSIGHAQSIDSTLQAALTAARHTEAGERFWREALQSANATRFPDLTPSALSGNRLVAAERTCAVAQQELDEVCRRKQCTVQALGQSAWATVLAAYVGEAGVTFGTVFSGRSTSSSNGVVFPAITTIPVYCDTSHTSTDLLRSMVEYNAAVQRHRFVPLSEIHRYADCTDQSLFDTVFVYQKTPSSDCPGLNWPTVRDTAAVDYTVSLELETGPTDAVKLRLTYDGTLVPAEQAHLILAQYEGMLAGWMEDRPTLDPCDSALYSIQPAIEPTLPSPVDLLHQFVERGAYQHPDRLALEFVYAERTVSDTWTYKELEEVSNKVAHLLRDMGVESGNIVAVCMDKCPEASFAFIGILKAGCAFLALDPDLPAARHEFILRDSSASLVFADAGTCDRLSSTRRRVVRLTGEILEALPATPVRLGRIDRHSLCYCLYTSGTTGQPKGCLITHDNAVQFLMVFQRMLAGHWDESSRWLQFASYWFDVSVLEQFWSWSAGINVIAAPRDLVLSDLTAFINTHKVTHIDLTPSLARLLHPDEVPSLCRGVFITGGEALKQEIIDTWGSKQAICNGYGPTEATIGVTMNPFIGPDAKPTSIGRQFDNVGTYALKPDTDEPVIRGAIGELCVSGRLVGQGYLNRPELTAKQFPILERFNERVYRTGDLVRLLADGSFSFVGRKDTQAKLRGQRLEVAEIDAVIGASSDWISDVVTMVAKAQDGTRELLVSFMVSNGGRSRQDLELDAAVTAGTAVKAAESACRSRLPGYMVPTHIIPINFLPLTVNNKVDTKRLSELFGSLSMKELQALKRKVQEVQSLDSTERKIGQVLSKILPVGEYSLHKETNIFSLGLSSVSAITFASLMKTAGFPSASVATIMRNPELGQLAKALSTDTQESDEDEASVRQAKLALVAFSQRYKALAAQRLSVDMNDIQAVALCTPLQQGLILESVTSSKAPYFNIFRYELASLDQQRLEKAFQILVSELQVLRIRFLQMDEGHIQVVLRQAELPWYVTDTSEPRQDALVARNRSQWVSRNEDDLLQPFEVHVAQTPGGNMMAVFIHHALYDGISWDLLMDRLAEIYREGRVEYTGPDFLEVLPYGPLRECKGARDFWARSTKDHIFVPLPTSLDRLATSTPVLWERLGDASALEAARKRMGVSHQALLQACFAIALHQFAPETQAYGAVVSGRSIAFEGADRVIGPLFNTLPYPIDLRPTESWAELVKRSHTLNSAMVPFQHTPLRDIRKWRGREPSDPMFDVLFVFQHTSTVANERFADLWRQIETEAVPEYPLAFEVSLDGRNQLAVTLVAQRTLADMHTLHTMLDHFQKALGCIVDKADERVSKDFSIVARATNPQQDPQHDSAPQINKAQDYTWTSEASLLRDQIAQLASVEPNVIDENSTIFSCGLDSIDAVKLSSRLKKHGMQILVSEILHAQTIPMMLQARAKRPQEANKAPGHRTLRSVERQLQEHLQLPSDPTERNEIERILPATPSQEALVAEMLRSDFREYYNHDILRIRPEVDLQRLQEAWQTVVNASPILRTAFIEVDDTEVDAVFAQIVYNPMKLHFDEQAAGSFSDMDAVVKHIRDSVRSDAQYRLPLRLTIVSTESERYLILSLSHAQYDGHSLALVHEDVKRAYQSTYKPRSTNDNTIEASLNTATEEARAFWRGTLTGTEACNFPTRSPEAVGSITHRAETTSFIPAHTARSFCKTHAVSMQALSQACLALLLAHYVQRLEVVFGVVLACRDSEEAEGVMFPMMNTVPIRASLHGSRRQMLRYMQGIIGDVLPFQRTPLRAIQGACGEVAQGGRDRGDATWGLFNTLFIYQHRPESSGDSAELLYDSLGGSSSVEYPVAMELEAIKDDLILRAACKDSVADHKGTSLLLERYDTILQAIIKSPDDPTVDLKGPKASICGLSSFEPKAQTAAGKPQEPDSAQLHSFDAHQLSPTALKVREALSKVSKLPADDISPNATTESIGVDSISAIKVATLLRKNGVKLSVSEILKAKTVTRIAEIADSVAQQSPPADSQGSAQETVQAYLSEHNLSPETVAAAHGLEAANVEAVLPATAGQAYILGIWQKSGGRLFYPTFTYRLRGEFDVQRIHEAWDRLLRHHGILRTVFCGTEHAEMPVVQVVLKEALGNFSCGAASFGMPAVCQPMVSLQALQTDASFDLALKIHHALYDAVSLPLLIQDFRAFLSGFTPARPRIKYEDFLALSLTPSSRNSRKNFWRQYLASAKLLRLPQPTRSGTQRRVEVFQPALFQEGAALASLARKEDITVQALLFAAYAKTYAGLAQKYHHIDRAKVEGGDEKASDVVIGIYLSNRAHLPALSDLVAPTLNLLPLLLRLAQERGLLELAREVQRDLGEMGTTGRSAVSLREVDEWTGVRVDTFVNFLKMAEAGYEDGGEAEEGVALEDMDDGRAAERSQVVELPIEGFEMSKELSRMDGMDVYQYSIDVEARVTNGALDMGVFCPEQMLGLAGAEGVLRGVRGLLERFVGKARE